MARYSRQREEILNAVQGTVCHPDAEWVYEKVRKVIPDLSLGTVYRNLRQLADSGKLLTLETELGKVRYDADLSDHSHFVCSECGQVSDIFIKSCVAEQLRDMGYAPRSEKTVFYGKCNKCADKK